MLRKVLLVLTFTSEIVAKSAVLHSPDGNCVSSATSLGRLKEVLRLLLPVLPAIVLVIVDAVVTAVDLLEEEQEVECASSSDTIPVLESLLDWHCTLVRS
jgi:hypothetical protein